MAYSDSIQGWFTYKQLYHNMVANSTLDFQWLEIGIWKGASIIYAAEMANLFHKDITFWAVDTWAGSNEKEHQDYIQSIGGPDGLFNEFCQNVINAKVNNRIKIVRLSSLEASIHFQNEQLDFLFVDGSHEYQDVKNDLLAWKDKVKKNGQLWGHDSDWPDVQKALNEVFPSRWTKHGDCWQADLTPRIN